MYQRIRDLREDSDKTQADMADILGMWLNTYRNYEAGNREPPFSFMIKLAQHYNVSLDYLAGITDIKENQEAKTQKHKRIIAAYERNKDMHKAVDKLLDIK